MFIIECVAELFVLRINSSSVLRLTAHVQLMEVDKLHTILSSFVFYSLPEYCNSR